MSELDLYLLEARLDRIEKAIRTTAAWLAQTPGVWGAQDVRGIDEILDGEPRASRPQDERATGDTDVG